MRQVPGAHFWSTHGGEKSRQMQLMRMMIWALSEGESTDLVWSIWSKVKQMQPHEHLFENSQWRKMLLMMRRWYPMRRSSLSEGESTDLVWSISQPKASEHLWDTAAGRSVHTMYKQMNNLSILMGHMTKPHTGRSIQVQQMNNLSDFRDTWQNVDIENLSILWSSAISLLLGG